MSARQQIRREPCLRAHARMPRDGVALRDASIRGLQRARVRAATSPELLRALKSLGKGWHCNLVAELAVLRSDEHLEAAEVSRGAVERHR